MKNAVTKHEMGFRIMLCGREKALLKLEEKYIREYLDANGYLYEIEAYYSMEDFLSSKENLMRYDIIYMQVSGNFKTCFRIANAVGKTGKPVYFIFISENISYALEGYKVNAFRFILKKRDTFKYCIQESLYAITTKAYRKKTMMDFHFISGDMKLDPDKIVYIESDLRKLTFHVHMKRMVNLQMNAKLNSIEDQLADYDFLRIHQSFLVNMHYIQHIKRNEMELVDFTKLPITRNRYSQVVNEYSEYTSFF